MVCLAEKGLAVYWYRAGVLPKEDFGSDYLYSLELLYTVSWPGVLKQSWMCHFHHLLLIPRVCSTPGRQQIRHCHSYLPPDTTEPDLTSLDLLLKAFLFSLPPAAVPQLLPGCPFYLFLPTFPMPFVCGILLSFAQLNP